jgi:hypothetical protein
MNWGYIVRSYASGGENTTDGNNIGYKHQTLLTTGDNYLALPYQMDLAVSTAAELATDITGAPTIAQWDPTTGLWDSSDFALTGGIAYNVTVAADTPYTIVGANRDMALTIQWNNIKGGVLNYVSLPYHNTLTDAMDLMTDINTNGGPSGQITRVAQWDGSVWHSLTAIGMNFSLNPAEGYLVVNAGAAMTSVNWKAPVPFF